MKTRAKVLISIAVLYCFVIIGWIGFDFYQVGMIFSLPALIFLYGLEIIFLVIIGIETWKK